MSTRSYEKSNSLCVRFAESDNAKKRRRFIGPCVVFPLSRGWNFPDVCRLFLRKRVAHTHTQARKTREYGGVINARRSPPFGYLVNDRWCRCKCPAVTRRHKTKIYSFRTYGTRGFYGSVRIVSAKKTLYSDHLIVATKHYLSSLPLGIIFSAISRETNKRSFSQRGSAPRDTRRRSFFARLFFVAQWNI